MEGLTRLVSESLARHGFDRPLDYRRLRWSRWFRCDSHHSLLSVPSKPGVFAIAEEIMNLGRSENHVETAASAVPPAPGAADLHTESEAESASHPEPLGEDFQRIEGNHKSVSRRMLAVTQFFEEDDMAFVLDRMMSRPSAMNARLASGRYFARFVVIEDQTQRRSICNALNQWMASATEKATGIGSHFASSLELTPSTEYISADPARAHLFEDKPMTVGRTFLSADAAAVPKDRLKVGMLPSIPNATAPLRDSGAATNIHCPSPFPSGF